MRRRKEYSIFQHGFIGYSCPSGMAWHPDPKRLFKNCPAKG
jgi:hypothetical protein